MSLNLRILFRHENEKLIKYGSIVLGLFIIILGLFIMFVSSLQSTGIVVMILGAVTSVLPSSLYAYFNFSKYSRMEEYFPRFLRDFAEAKKSGMTFPDAFKSRMNTDYGELNEEIARASHQLSWGMPFVHVMSSMSKRLKYSPIMRRSFTIILEAFNAGGDVTDVMDDLSTDIKNIKEINDERKSEMSQQVIMMYFVSFLFLGITLMLYHILIPLISSGMMTVNVSGSSAMAEVVDYCTYVPFLCSICLPFGFGEGQLCYMEALFFVMAIVQAITSGLIAGEINEGSVAAGVKHALFLMVAAFIVFIIFG
ncbi:MAG: type II secretion system F family protein [archaeon]|nr:type II secretion system F family protein [archaeon]